MTLQNPSILIVEDSSTVRQMLSLNLKQLSGCKISEAANGPEALAKLSAQPVDLILTDINMPVMDGRKPVGFLRQNASLKDIPIITTTTTTAAPAPHPRLSPRPT